MNLLLILIIAIPFVAFLLTLLWQNKNEKPIGLIVRGAKLLNIGVVLALAVVWFSKGRQAVWYEVITIYKTKDFVFACQLYYDEITLVFSVVGAVLFFLVATFSKYYMHRDEGYKRFFNTILFFATGYNLIIFAGNFETLFIGWEIKGLCSFLLIAFYRKRYLPVKNAFKTVSYYRISDLSIILAMWMMHHLMHQNISFLQLGDANIASAGQAGMAIFISLMFILPSLIKSAQFPFTSWLPRAMEGPTNSSAIFYGSLSVHIGVFLLLRTHPFWENIQWVKILIITAGAVTAVVASLTARVQPTVKTQIAYASAAQIGLMFIEIGLGFHWLVLLHFAGNAFLRTYQLLVSPSVLNYLVHHQYFHYSHPVQKKLPALKAGIFIMGVKEWNMDRLMYRYLWSPFKWVGRQFYFLNEPVYLIVLSLVAGVFCLTGLLYVGWPDTLSSALPIFLFLLALIVILFSFASRQSASRAWTYLLTGHLFILAAMLCNSAEIKTIELVFYASGVFAAWLLGFFCLQKVKAIDRDISLHYFHGYVYEAENTGLFFLIAAIGILGFPVTTAFIGMDVLFTYIQYDQYFHIILLALCFIFIELSAFRILLRIFLGPHKKLDHPVAFRSS